MTRGTRIATNASLVVLAASLCIVYSYEYGPDPGYTAAPGDNPTGCEAQGCHTSTPNSNGGSVKIVASGGATYVPGQMQQIMVTIADSAERRFGFELTARIDSNPRMVSAGTLAPTDAKTQLIDCRTAGVVPFSGSCPSGNTLQWIEHSMDGWSASVTPSTTYTFNWTPPATDVGPITLYAAGNAGSGAKLVNLTHTYLTSLHLTAGSASSTPSIGSVTSASDFGGFSNFASGSWIEIKGTGLASNTRPWAQADFTGSNAPTSLDGTSATVNGKPAAVFYISSQQINVQAPADSTTGSVSIVVTSPSGMASVSAVKTATAPGLLAPASFNINGKQYLVAQVTDSTGTYYVGNSGLIAGAAFRPAKPGETIVVYGVGFGDVTPAIAPGVVVGQQNSLTNPVTVSFGSTSATLTYQGLSPGFVGLYQFNIIVPQVPDGDYQINVTQNGAAVPQTFFLTVHS